MNIDRRSLLLWVSATAFAFAAKPVTAFTASPSLVSYSDGLTLFVDPSGSDLNDGLSCGVSGAFRTLRTAIAFLSEHPRDAITTINLGSGNYPLSDLPPLDAIAG